MSKPSTRPREVFLSHASGDRRAADRLAEVLRSHGIPVWYSRTNILGAQQWHDEIGEALGRCDAFIVLLSPQSVRSKWVKHELMYSLRESRYEERIVPVLLKSCDLSRLSWTLPAFQLIDLSKDFEYGCQELLRIWGIGYVPDPPRRNPRKTRGRLTSMAR